LVTAPLSPCAATRRTAGHDSSFPSLLFPRQRETRTPSFLNGSTRTVIPAKAGIHLIKLPSSADKPYAQCTHGRNWFEDNMFYSILLVFSLIQFLLILGALVFALFFARPEVPLAGAGPEETQAVNRPSDAGEQSKPGEEAATLRRHDLHYCHTHLAA